MDESEWRSRTTEELFGFGDSLHEAERKARLRSEKRKRERGPLRAEEEKETIDYLKKRWGWGWGLSPATMPSEWTTVILPELFMLMREFEETDGNQNKKEKKKEIAAVQFQFQLTAEEKEKLDGKVDAIMQAYDLRKGIHQLHINHNPPSNTT